MGMSRAEVRSYYAGIGDALIRHATGRPVTVAAASGSILGVERIDTTRDLDDVARRGGVSLSAALPDAPQMSPIRCALHVVAGEGTGISTAATAALALCESITRDHLTAVVITDGRDGLYVIGVAAGAGSPGPAPDGWLAAIHPNDRDRIERDWRDCIRTGTVFDGSYRVRTKTGSYRHYDVRAVPIERDGAIIEWMGASTDVTGQREADEMRGRLTEQLSAAALRTSRLQQATSLLAEALSVQQVITVITDVGRSAIGADRSAVAMVVDNDRLRLRVIRSDASSDGPAQLPGEMALSVPGVMTAAIALRRSVVFDSPDSLRRYFEAEQDGELLLGYGDEQAWVGLPLTTSGAPLGALQFAFTSPHQITDEERVFLEALAGQGALALERAKLYEREHATAETLQRSLLPDTLPDVPGIALRATYKPVSIEVGGDWYDAFRLPDGKLAVAAGDVMGKGLTAAAGMGRVRNALRALALTDPRPAAVLAGLDRLFLATELDEQVTTVCYLVVDPRTGQGVAGNAGHLPPLLLSPGEPPRLDQTEAGTPLGWASPRHQYPFSLPRGNTAVLYSDGLVENRRRGLDSGLDELVAVAGQAPPDVVADPQRLIDYLVEKMLAGYEQDDDVTVLVLQMPEPDPAGPRQPGQQVRAGRGRGLGRARG